jgi:hypothetical protein
MGIVSAWMVLVSWLVYQHGIKQSKLPEPHYFIGATAALSVAALVGEANENVGTVLMWGIVIAAFVSGQFKSVPNGTETGPTSKTAQPSNNTSSSNASNIATPSMLPTTGGGFPIQ